MFKLKTWKIEQNKDLDSKLEYIDRLIILVFYGVVTLFFVFTGIILATMFVLSQKLSAADLVFNIMYFTGVIFLVIGLFLFLIKYE